MSGALYTGLPYLLIDIVALSVVALLCYFHKEPA